MNLTDSPSLQENGQTPSKHSSPHLTKFRIVLLVLIMLAISIVILNAFPMNIAELVTGKGTLTGRVLDENGAPLIAQVFVFGVDRPVTTSADGSFTYPNVPAGERNLIIGFNGTAEELNVTVQAGKSIDLGEIWFQVVTPTAIP